MQRLLLFCLILPTPSTLVSAGWGGPGGGWGGNGDGNGSPWGYDGGGNGDEGDSGDGSGSGSDPSSSTLGAEILGSPAAYNRYIGMLIAHAVLASLVWVILIPAAALLLRINISNPIVLKLHAASQIILYLIFVVAAGLGVWLANQSPATVWADVHPRLGLAILVVAFFQPVWGYVHHRIFRKRAIAEKAGRRTKPPGRTGIGRVHLWVGRLLILLATINGGLGIRLAGKSPMQSSSTTKKAAIGYGVVAGIVLVVYAILVVTFEVGRRRARNTGASRQGNTDKLPTYDESQSSLSQGPTRYQ